MLREALLVFVVQSRVIGVEGQGLAQLPELVGVAPSWSGGLIRRDLRDSRTLSGTSPAVRQEGVRCPRGSISRCVVDAVPWPSAHFRLIARSPWPSPTIDSGVKSRQIGAVVRSVKEPRLPFLPMSVHRSCRVTRWLCRGYANSG